MGKHYGYVIGGRLLIRENNIIKVIDSTGFNVLSGARLKAL